VTTTRTASIVSVTVFAVGCLQATGGGTPVNPARLNKFAASGVEMRLDFFYSVNPDCTPKGNPVVRLVRAAQYGRIAIKEDTGYPNFAKGSQYNPCNRQKVPVTAVTYVSNPGYTGADSAAVETIFPDGDYMAVEYSIVVK
jgi:hypothetical protein